jgi:hypothetical protein
VLCFQGVKKFELKKEEPDPVCNLSGALVPVRGARTMREQDHPNLFLRSPQEFPWPSDSDQRFYPEDDCGEDIFQIEIEQVEDADSGSVRR